MTNHPSANRLRALEQALRAADCDLYVVPMVDEFQGEYIPEYAARLPFLTGFTGSAGMGVFWAQPSAEQRHTLFVDGRYTLQAAGEVDTNELLILNSGDVSFGEWLASRGENTLRIAVDGWLASIDQLTRWKQATAHADVEWITARPNLVDGMWAEQPAPPTGEVILQPLEYAGVSYADKRTQMLESIGRYKADAVLLTQPDAVNWLLNIRGSDVPFNPLLLSYLILHKSGKATLYSFPHQLGDDVRDYLAAQQVTVADIAELFAGKLEGLSEGMCVLVDTATTPYAFAELADKHGVLLVTGDDPTQLPKALKNTVELEGIRAAHLRDGLALTRFLHWFNSRVENKKLFDELEVVAALESFRAKDQTYRGPSFATIAGTGPHGAIIHYRADEKSNRRARNGDIFLLDSGGQYPDGTTDVTRTLAIGAATTAMKEHFTRVLKGHIALASAQFPPGTSGSQLDILARQPLWAVGLDFDHGTGHGVGAYLCVHEGPQRISKRGSAVPLQQGMIISNEPGYYLAGHYGIRIENLVTVVQTGARMLGFETLTLAPIDLALVEVALLTSDERNWLNNYHQRVYQAHASALELPVRDWLARATRAV